MHPCAVADCTIKVRKDEKIFTYFTFPEDEQLRKTWLTLCGRDVESDCSEFRVCARHFDNGDFERDLRFELLGEHYQGIKPSRKRLKIDSVPHLNLMKIKEEPIDVEDCNDELRTPSCSVPVEFTSTDVKWWKDVDNSNRNDETNRQAINPAGNEFSREIFETNPVKVAIQNQQSTPTNTFVGHAPSSLPASQTWPGEYGFTLSFSPQEKNTKGVAWTYSKVKDKLYVGKDAPCPINFSTNMPLPDDVTIKVMALYTSPDQVSEIVKRCVNHSMEEIRNDIFEAEHLIRCESSMALYQIDAATGRHSVVVPFENPPVGQQYSTYIYKFACFGSCAGGPNRRPLMLIFTLERGNQVIGRRKLDVKICACPGRDRKTEETQHMEAENAHRRSVKRKDPVEFVSLSDTLNFTKSVSFPLPKKTKIASSKDGFYSITVEDHSCYEFLLQMKTFYEVSKIMEDLSPDITKALLNCQKKKHEDKSA